MPNYVQNSYGLYPKVGIAGARAASNPNELVSTKVARNSLYPGRFAFLVPGYGGSSYFLSPGQVYQVPSPVAAADVDAILATGGASAATPQTYSGADFDGVVGTSKMYPGRRVTLVLSSHTDWDATTAVLTAKRNGVTLTENLSIPNGGNATVTSVGAYDEIVSLTIPAQTGAGGTFTIGIAALTAAASSLKDFAGVAMHTPMLEQDGAAGTGLVYADGAAVDLMESGDVFVEAEEAMTAFDDVYVRVATGAGGTLLGKVRNDDDSSSCVQHTGAKVVEYDATTGLVHLRLK